MVLGLMILTFLTSASMVRALMMATFGLVAGTMGLDNISVWPGLPSIFRSFWTGWDCSGGDGPFRISEVLLNIELKVKREVFTTKVKGLLPTLEDWGKSIWSILRGTILVSSWEFFRGEARYRLLCFLRH